MSFIYLIFLIETPIFGTLIYYKLFNGILSQVWTPARGLRLSVVLKSNNSLVSVSKCMFELDI